MNYMYRDLVEKVGVSSTSSNTSEDKVQDNGVTYYRVNSRDTLSGIAAKYNTTYQYLAKINGIDNPNLIYEGQVLIVPASKIPNTNHTYTVKSGDSLWSIAQTELGDGSRYPEIKSLNGLASDTIYPGQNLKIPG